MTPTSNRREASQNGQSRSSTSFRPRKSIPIYFAERITSSLPKEAEGLTALPACIAQVGVDRVVKFHLRERQHLGGLRVQGNVLALEQL